MSSRNGQLITCDRCGAEIFSACAGEGTRRNIYKKPHGWGVYKGKDLCPDCAKEWNKIETAFLNQQEYFFNRG